jgi:(p)ppGpp synthase/HD superfamily hydrolase
MKLLERAIIFAAQAHGGQTDKAGRPYILHPLRVMMRLSQQDRSEDDEARIAAVLHDVVEDCEITLQHLAAHGYSSAVLMAIDALSRRDDERYAAYIMRLAENPLAVRVKIADLEDNLDPNRDSTRSLSSGTVAKYRDALRFLVERQEERRHDN